MNAPIRKAVFPVAGLGTRFLPATKASPKEMLPVVDKPLVQYAVEEAVEAGVDTIIFVTGRNKRPIPDHFDRAYELENELMKKGKHDRLQAVRDVIPDHVDCVYIRQAEALGLGHAVLCARNIVGNEPFYVVLADDLVHNGGKGCLAQMGEQFDQLGHSLIGVQQIPQEHSNKYGIVAGDKVSDQLRRLNRIVEKPAPENAPSNWGVIGRYALTPRIFHHLENTPRGAGNEIQLTDAIDALQQEEAVYAYNFHGKRYDCGDKLGYLEATVEMALKHPELGGPFADYLMRYAREQAQSRAS
ncbi:UTP--glucose-1-phosphate uridylyltransferase GalU [Natronospira bacteriovora]|uniref:UTP--glucose-1-phosphate uridylyltransferase n=1 Tax=Natronospira bacteriovora TaxID=3069753 RepID=A0ABU0WB39_9GAMM|nr:UTP--glucose-1-phosphate uridylyltransferase GalU [Natronospira sp. AB-CW4]MDQ2070155.1 UTP--glucose-1-phosphate uridylyltransferase GalU [Natronospira sp. AB-CW4]